MIKPKDKNQTSQRCSVTSKTIGTWSTSYRLREGEHSVSTGENFIQILAWKKKFHIEHGTYILYNIANSYLVWKAHRCFSNTAELNSMSCPWAHCQLHCIHIGTNFSFLAEQFFYIHPEFLFLFIFFYRMDVLGRS